MADKAAPMLSGLSVTVALGELINHKDERIAPGMMGLTREFTLTVWKVGRRSCLVV